MSRRKQKPENPMNNENEKPRSKATQKKPRIYLRNSKCQLMMMMMMIGEERCLSIINSYLLLKYTVLKE